MGLILDQIIQEGLKSMESSDIRHLHIGQVMEGVCIHTMSKVDGVVFNDLRFFLILTDRAYGFAYHQGHIAPVTIAALVGKPLEEIVRWQLSPAIKTAVADCVYNAVNRPYRYRSFNGDVPRRAEQRAKTIVQDIEGGAKVLLLGAVSEIAREVVARGAALHISDIPTKR